MKSGDFNLRHLFSGVESWKPVRKERSGRRDEHSHAVYHAVLYARGRGLMNLDGAELPFEPGLLVLCSPGQPHKFGAHDDCGCEVEYRNFTFDLEGKDGELCEASFKELLETLWGSPLEGFKSAQTLGAEAMKELLHALDAAMALNLGREELPGPDAAGTVLTLLGKLFKISARNAATPRQTAPDERLLKAKSLIENDLKGELGVEQIARAAGLSRAHFIRSFKACFGDSPKRFSRRLRLDRARGMLSFSALGEKAIAAETGFCDEFHLCKLFKAEYAETPSSFRRKALRERT